MTDTDCIVIGAGVVGLAIARALARRGRGVLVLERARAIGTGVSSRSSEVVHAGLHGAPHDLKVRLCIEGRRFLLRFCEARAIPHRRCGKLIVAPTATEVPALHALLAQGQRNGVEGLRLLDPAEACALEPALACQAALLSEATGIVDSHALMQALRADAERAGAVVVLDCEVDAVVAAPLGVRVGAEMFAARAVVNAAGLDAPRLAVGKPRRLAPVKGSYFTISGRVPFSRLIYPLPEAGGLGVHLTLDLGGRARFGPDAEPVSDPEDLVVDAARAPGFETSVRRWWPALPSGALKPDYAGVRPRIEGARDFLIEDRRVHGVEGLVQLLGIESPGLTASLAIARSVAELLG